MIATVPERYTLKHILAPTRITSERQYDEYAETLMRLDEKAEKARLSHQEESYAKILAAFIEEWDETHHPIDDASPIEVLQTLMEANNLRQKDLAPIFGTESIVSEVLHQKRALTVNHIVGLSQRFHVSPAVFFAERKIVAPKRNVLKTWTKVAKPNFEAARARAAAKMARAQRARWAKVRGAAKEETP